MKLKPGRCSKTLMSRKQKKLYRYLEEGSILKLKSYLRKHHGLSVNFSLRKGRTLLHAACALCDDAMVRVLLKHGADPLLQDHRGNTALHVAARQAAKRGQRVYEDLVVLLKKHCPAALEVINRDGKTPCDLLQQLETKEPSCDTAASGRGTDGAERAPAEVEREWHWKLYGECQDEFQESFGQYDEDFCRVDPEPESFHDWAERIAREYSRKRQQDRPSGNHAKAAEEQRRDKERREFQQRLEQEHCQYQERALQQQQELRSSKKQRYEHQCATVFSTSATQQLRFHDIPWPCPKGGVEDMVAVILHGVDSSDAVGYRRYLRRQQAIWHPDKFLQCCGPRLYEADRQQILDTVTALSQNLNKLAGSVK
ncbi:NF-kappa-B inhibitor-like protein 1 [Rhinatrema bivittatum]|uniref:NF-kappa-B inhibitor-like protein 1 n=1 Tax=Rhinatrema bivittatum TaxID=194408 RepID=UPI00112CE555|nr:NF-kappa-B inhibitor-like protein 1 [Rhinatrema bivittatum]XP_029434851.1 NF-kappa-B inhibitor-like protein 1 [Rhinatrema bivittatum]XP_029434852.1 NF-kappa-B inhibitor-like protein 1 [Rhinatrema bivittatum]